MDIWDGVDPVSEARRFAELWSVEGPVLVDVDGSFAAELGVRGVPTNIFVDAEGMVTEVGAMAPTALEAATRRLLGPGADIDPPTVDSDWHWGQDPAHIEKHVMVHSDTGSDQAAGEVPVDDGG